jgi:hypothetical protein|tara:strand:- start:1131 stop:1382 length:252 start_codon:yes stop_codon:yes gene_type:complete
MGKWHREVVTLGIEFDAEVVGLPRGEELWPGSSRDEDFKSGFGRYHSVGQIEKAARKALKKKPMEWLLERITLVEYKDEEEEV